MNDERDGYGFEAERRRGEIESGTGTGAGDDTEGIGGAGGTTLPFGPHAGRGLDEIAGEDPDYLVALVHLGLGSSELRLAAARAVLRRDLEGGAVDPRTWLGARQGRASLAAPGDVRADGPSSALATREVEPGPLDERALDRPRPRSGGRPGGRAGGVRLLGRWDCALALACLVVASAASLAAWRLWDRGGPPVGAGTDVPVATAGRADAGDVEAQPLVSAANDESSGREQRVRNAGAVHEAPVMDDAGAPTSGTGATTEAEAPAGVDPSAPCGARVEGAIPADSAADFLDTVQAVELEVVATKDTGKVTFLNSRQDYQGHFYVAIFPDDYAAFPAPPAEHFRGRCVVIQGRIELYRGSPQIVLREPGDLQLVPGEG